MLVNNNNDNFSTVFNCHKEINPIQYTNINILRNKKNNFRVRNNPLQKTFFFTFFYICCKKIIFSLIY